MQTADLTNLGAVLALLAGPAGIVAWMVYVSNWFRNAAEVKPDGSQLIKWSSWVTQLITAAVSFSLPIAAFLILKFVPAETLEAIAPYYQFLASVFLAYLGQQLWYAFKTPSTTTTVSVSVPAGTPATSEAKAQPSQPVTVSVGAAPVSDMANG